MQRWLLFLCLVSVSVACQAERFLYRMDMRPPDAIFATGFIPPGVNTNLYRHVTGQTCYFSEQTSGFVATTSDAQFALDWGSEVVRRGRRFYVYRIRQTAQFYNTTTSLMHAYAATAHQPYREAARTFVEQSEWASRGTIPRHTIVDAAEYVSRGPAVAPERVTTHINLHYVAAPSTVVTTPYIWNYSLDAPSEPDSPGAVCGSSCFGFSLFAARGRRETPGDTRRNVLACRSKVQAKTAAMIALFDETPAIEERIKDEQ
ncbi:Pertussis toxin, subunit 1 [Luteibacter sp. UNCMF331Sha3.1]|uniref:scabin-related ADP-ribosyltransferase n=1 Tax=Luteibacter sp. UNCMF331Sha3.1 TaxID=1502760 RepID=UPI0008D84747|nr:enterotoxin A family protein [Luteibacter sp. UNCMF331Sha3.1]SEM38628.1 Pertussis toxin, subunit 1 [Luteibacter sp. UNCMF331Sha3.1]